MKRNVKRQKKKNLLLRPSRIIGIWSKRRTLYLVLFLVLVLVVVFAKELNNFFSKLNLEQWELIRRYVQTIFSWPAVVLVISLIFMSRFSDSIKKFLENSNFIKAGPVEMGQHQAPPPAPDISDQKVIENVEEKGVKLTDDEAAQIQKMIDELTEEKNAKEMQIADKDKLIDYLAERAEINEFAYLNQFLVSNSKRALLFLDKQRATREYFLVNFGLLGIVPNQNSEKEAILNVLLVNSLIENKNGILMITEKGKRFLKFTGASK